MVVSLDHSEVPGGLFLASVAAKLPNDALAVASNEKADRLLLHAALELHDACFNIVLAVGGVDAEAGKLALDRLGIDEGSVPCRRVDDVLRLDVPVSQLVMYGLSRLGNGR